MKIHEIEKIREFLALESGLDITAINDNTKLKDLNLDSLGIMNVFVEIENEYDIFVAKTAKDLEELNFNQKTFQDLILHLDEKIKEKNN